MRISENPIIHYGTLAGAAATIFAFVGMVGVNIEPPWITRVQAAEITKLAMDDLRAKYDIVLERLQADQLQLKLRDLDASLIDTKERECKARHEHNAEATRFATDRITFLKEQYFTTAQRVYDMPDCKALGLEE